MKRKDPLKILTNQTKANVSFLMMSSPNGTISSNVALNRRKLRKLLFTHYISRHYCILQRVPKLKQSGHIVRDLCVDLAFANTERSESNPGRSLGDNDDAEGSVWKTVPCGNQLACPDAFMSFGTVFQTASSLCF